MEARCSRCGEVNAEPPRPIDSDESTDSPPLHGARKPCEERHSARGLSLVSPPTSEHGVGSVESLPWAVDGTEWTGRHQ